MKHNTFEPCKDHENGHFNWCLLCEIASLREKIHEMELEKIRLTLRIERAGEKEYMKDKKYSDLSVHHIVNSWCK